MKQVREIPRPPSSIDNLIPLTQDELRNASIQESLEVLSDGNKELRIQLETILNADSEPKDTPSENMKNLLSGIKIVLQTFWSKILLNAFILFYLLTHIRRAKTRDNFYSASPTVNILCSVLFHLILIHLLLKTGGGGVRYSWVPTFYLTMLATNILSGLIEIGRYPKTAKEIDMVIKKYPFCNDFM